MKLSVVIAGSGAPENAFVVWRGYEASIRKAAAMGYQGVELALGGAEDVDADALDAWLDETGLTVSCVSTGLVYAQRGLYMTHPDPAKRAQTVALFAGLARLAQGHGGLINVGRARGFVGEGQTRAEAEALFLGCMAEILPEARARGVHIIIEPINRYESNFLNSLDDAASLLDRLPYDNVGIMADLFHMNIEDDDLAASLRRNARYVRYVHIADSNRRAPGMGHTDFAAVLNALEDIGYDGWLSAEVLPGGDADGTAAAVVRHMQPLLARRGGGRA